MTTLPASGIRPDSRAILDMVLDSGTFNSWDEDPGPSKSLLQGYAQNLERAREKTGHTEAVITGRGDIHGLPVAVIVSEFAFLAGSMGVHASKRVHDAISRATSEGLPVIACPASGGTRMQEGTGAFVQMLKITAAIETHKAQGLPYLVYLRHPTTGGVMASWGSLGHLTAAEPEALLGFLGPKVYKALNGTSFPSGIQTSENLHRCGIVDAVVAADGLKTYLWDILAVLSGDRSARNSSVATGPDKSPFETTGSGWESVQLSRDPARPGPREILASAEHVTYLNGTGQGETGRGVFVALAEFARQPCVVIGHTRDTAVDPAGLRQAQRGMELAEQLRLPLLSLIDTVGAELSVAAEESSMAGEIARSIARLISLRTSTISLILGQGTGGGALALLPADRMIAAQHAWLAPLAPEGASAILYKTTSEASRIAQDQGITAADLHAGGIIDRVLPDPVDAAPDALIRQVSAAIVEELNALTRSMAANRPRPEIGRRERLSRLGNAVLPV